MGPMEESYSEAMRIALEEARVSLREGNKGFGAVLVKDGEVVARAHDRAVTDSDPTAHAEMNLVREASKRFADLSGCAVVSTHEPCPMCTGALVWARVSEIAYGASIEGSRRQGRTMIDLGCREIVERAPWKVTVTGGVLEEKCSRLYDEDVRKLVKAFRSGDGPGELGRALLERRVAWFDENADALRGTLRGTAVDRAYQLILMKIGIDEEEAPIVERSDVRIVFHSMNFCPALEACEILGLDTREVCREHTERATEALIRRIDDRLRFERNYERLRPRAPYCEETISLGGPADPIRTLGGSPVREIDLHKD